MGHPSSGSWDWCAFAIFISAFLVRFFLVSTTFHPQLFDRLSHNYLIFSKYPWVAHKLVSDIPIGTRILNLSPLYTGFITILYRVLSNSYFYYILLQMVIGAFGCVLIYMICTYLFHPRVAVIAGLIALFYKPFILYEDVLAPVTVVIFLNLLSVYLLLYCAEKSVFSEYGRPCLIPLQGYTGKSVFRRNSLLWLLPGIGLGLSVATRPNIPILLCGVVVWIIYIGFKRPLRIGNALFFVAAGFCIVMIPLLARNFHHSQGRLQFVMSPEQVFYQGNNPMARGFYGAHPYLLKEVEREPGINTEQMPDFAPHLYPYFAQGAVVTSEVTSDAPLPANSFWCERSLHFIAEFPLHYLRLILQKFRFFWSRYEIHDIRNVFYLDREIGRFPLLTFGLVIPLAILGMILCVRGFMRYLLLYAAVGNYLFFNILFVVSSRQRLPAIPFMIPFAAYALHEGAVYLVGLIYSLGSSSMSLFKGKSLTTSVRDTLRHISPLMVFLGGALLLVLIFMGVNHPSGSVEHFTLLLDVDRDARTSARNAFDLLNRQECKSARTAFQVAFALNPFNDSRVPARFLGGASRACREGIRFWEEVLRTKPDHTYARFMLGYLLFRAGLYDQAIRTFSGLADEGVEGYYGYTLPISQPRYYLARCLEEKGEPEGALHQYELLNKMRPGLPWVVTRLVVLYERNGRFEEATAAARILERVDNPISSSYLLAEAYYGYGNYEKARGLLEKLNGSIVGLYAPYHFLLSACYAGHARGNSMADTVSRKQMLGKAIEECGVGLSLRPQHDPDYPEILYAYEEAIADSPKDARLHLELGTILFNRGELERSRTPLRDALVLMKEGMPQEMVKSVEMRLQEIDFLKGCLAPGPGIR
ncbi:MAG: tetratricopeptide repeat protein [bacterium]